MKGLSISDGKYNFVIELDNILYIDSYAKVKRELDDFPVGRFCDLVENTDNSADNIVFLKKDNDAFGILVEKVSTVIDFSDIESFDSENIFIRFSKGIVIHDYIKYYLIDSKKLFEVLYEKQCFFNR